MRKIVARSNQRPGRKDGSPKPTGAPASIDGAAISRNDEDRGRTLKWMLVTMALLAAVTVALAGLGFYFLHDSKSAWNGRDASIATFVGSEICAGCHRAQAELWQRCSTSARWTTQPIKWCWVIFPIQPSTITG